MRDQLLTTYRGYKSEWACQPPKPMFFRDSNASLQRHILSTGERVVQSNIMREDAQPCIGLILQEVSQQSSSMLTILHATVPVCCCWEVFGVDDEDLEVVSTVSST